MSENQPSGVRKIPEAEKKFGLTLLAQLNFSPDEPVSVVIIGTERSEEVEVLEAVKSALIDETSVRSVAGVMVSATVNPPDIRSKLADIASNDGVRAIELNEPLMPITVPKSYFH